MKQEETKMHEPVRRICEFLPETEEIIDGFGHTVFQVNGKSFIRIGGTQEKVSLSFKSYLRAAPKRLVKQILGE